MDNELTSHELDPDVAEAGKLVLEGGLDIAERLARHIEGSDIKIYGNPGDPNAAWVFSNREKTKIDVTGWGFPPNVWMITVSKDGSELVRVLRERESGRGSVSEQHLKVSVQFPERSDRRQVTVYEDPETRKVSHVIQELITNPMSVEQATLSNVKLASHLIDKANNLLAGQYR